MRIYDCTPSHHAFREGPFRVESGARLLVDVDDEPMDCCTVTKVQRRRASVPSENDLPDEAIVAMWDEGMFTDSVEFQTFLDSLDDSDG